MDLQLVVCALLSSLRLTDDGLGGLDSKLTHAALGALDSLEDPVAGALHGTVRVFAVNGAAHCRASGFNLLDDGGSSGCDRARGCAVKSFGDGARGRFGGKAHGALGSLSVAGLVAVDSAASRGVGRVGGR